MLDQIKSAKNIHVIGVSGTEGAAVALFLQKLGIDFTAHDFSEEKRFERSFKANHFGYPASKREKILKALLESREQINFKNSYLKDIGKADLIFVSQNWEAYSPNGKLKKIFASNPERFATITQLYFQLFPGKILAITGTNGKSTTAKLVSEIMKSSGHSSRQSWFTGNDRRNIQILDCLDRWTKKDWLVVEVSNRQLKFPLGRSPDIGLILNVSPNHLDEYDGSFSAYRKGKFSLIADQTKKQIAVLNYDNLSTRQFIKKTKSQAIVYSTEKNLSTGVYIKDGWIVDKRKGVHLPARQSSRQRMDTKICPLAKIKLLGEHNLSNILAAVAATRSAGVSKKIICENINKFRGIPQRLEFIFEKRGVQFINDSASTTPESTIAALQSFPQGSVSLVAGGESKGMDYTSLAREIKRQEVKITLLKSPLANILNKLLKKEKVEFEIVETLQEAILISAKNAGKGSIVLLSPSAAWFCYFAGKIPLGGRGFEKFVKTLV